MFEFAVNLPSLRNLEQFSGAHFLSARAD